MSAEVGDERRKVAIRAAGFAAAGFYRAGAPVAADYFAALEDRTLQERLPGYKEYAQRVRYRLAPGVW